jgi:tetratricopeptide (TPR) repeat protein
MRGEGKMANTLNGAGGAGADFLLALDFNSAIAACTAGIEQRAATPATTPPAAPVTSLADDYLCRGYAHCFVTEKDGGNFDKAIADCSRAIHFGGLTAPNNEATAHRIRALAYYLKGDRAQALADCAYVLDPAHGADAEDQAFIRGLRTKLRCETDGYEAALQDCRDSLNIAPPPPPPPPANNIFPDVTTAENYRLACKKLHS